MGGKCERQNEIVRLVDINWKVNLGQKNELYIAYLATL
jgi:hypothetical protein